MADEVRTFSETGDIPLVIFSTTGNGYVDAWVNGSLVLSVEVKPGPVPGEDVARAVSLALTKITRMGCLDY